MPVSWWGIQCDSKADDTTNNVVITVVGGFAGYDQTQATVENVC